MPFHNAETTVNLTECAMLRVPNQSALGTNQQVYNNASEKRVERHNIAMIFQLFMQNHEMFNSSKHHQVTGPLEWIMTEVKANWSPLLQTAYYSPITFRM